MSKTLVVTHVMPLELEMFERFISYYKNCFKYLDSNDDVTMYVTLNLNPKLTDWDNSELKQQWFIDKFTQSMSGIRSHLQIIVDDSLWGTTQQKREVLKLEYDYFIFVDPDIAVNEHQLKLQLMAAENVRERGSSFVISPNIPRWWDKTWDVLVSSNRLNGEFGEAFEKECIKDVLTQKYTDLSLRLVAPIKFGNGMHTLYSKEFWDFIKIPESFGGYGPEDTFAMYASHNAIVSKQYPIKQYVLDGIYITEDYTHRIPSFNDNFTSFNKKDEFYKKAESLFDKEMDNFLQRI